MNIPTQNPIKLKVIERLNRELGKDIKSLNKIDEIKTQFINEKETALKKIDLKNIDSHTIVKDAINKLNKDIKSIDEINNEFELYSTNAIQYLGTTNDIVKHLQDYVNKIKSLEIIIEYFNISKKIQNISNELYQSIVENDDELSVTLYANLCEIQLNLSGCPATHLLIYLKDVIHHWHNYLKDKFSVIFDEILKQIKWPFVNTNLTSPILNSNNESIIKLQTYCEYLLQIQLPPPNEQLQEFTTQSIQICLPIQLLIRPLKKRFQYHFYGNKQTNRADKPEWYMTQILTWIRDHQQFILNIIQPVINRLAMHHINARIEFMKGLIQICIDKLDNELPTLAYDDALFSHCVDETLGMDRELRTVYNLPINQSGCLTPLTNPVILQKWLNMEKKYALEKMDSIFTSLTALQNIILNDDVDSDNGDSIKITECGNTFITLLKTMSERYQSLPQPGHRLQFLDLQLDLLDDFRIRLLQLSHSDNTLTTGAAAPSSSGPLSLSFTSRISYILNTISYIIDTLIEWSETIHFINLHYFKSQFIKQHGHSDTESSGHGQESKETESVFDETISFYTHMKNDLISTLTETVVLDVKARSRAYRHDTWNTMQYINDDRSLSLTTSGCPMYQILATRLHELNELLTIQIFTSVWKLIAKNINLFLYDELILENFFNDGGAKQLHYDIMKNLLPLFAQYTNKPQIYFNTIIEACTLLVLSKSTAILLMDTLNNESIQTQKDALQELGVRKLNIEDALNILKLRSDLREVIYRHF